MKHWQRIELQKFGGPENLKLVVEDELPVPERGQVRVKVLAAGTGFTDTIVRKGQYVDVKEKPPFTLGYDWFGVVDALGPDVDRFSVGDYVADMPAIGGYTQYLCAPAEQLVPCPAGLDPAEAVCMMLSYTTAWQMLSRECPLKSGDSILVHAAAGAVGTALLELGRLKGLRVFGTASAGKHDLVRSLGGIPIDYRNEDFVRRIQTETRGEGVAAVFDTIGGKNWARSYRCVAQGGHLVGFGALQVTTGEESVPQLLWGFAKLLGWYRLIPDGRKTSFYNILQRRKSQPQDFITDVQELMELLKKGAIKPVVAERAPLMNAAEVHRRIDEATIAGKVVLICNEE